MGNANAKEGDTVATAPATAPVRDLAMACWHQLPPCSASLKSFQLAAINIMVLSDGHPTTGH